MDFSNIIAFCLGDIVAMERVAHEFCEDISSHGVLYVEARYVKKFNYVGTFLFQCLSEVFQFP